MTGVAHMMFLVIDISPTVVIGPLLALCRPPQCLVSIRDGSVFTGGAFFEFAVIGLLLSHLLENEHRRNGGDQSHDPQPMIRRAAFPNPRPPQFS